jgi:hypothetical protein
MRLLTTFFIESDKNSVFYYVLLGLYLYGSFFLLQDLDRFVSKTYHRTA